MSAQSIRATYSRNVETLRRCQLAYDRMEPDYVYEKGPVDENYDEVIDGEE